MLSLKGIRNILHQKNNQVSPTTVCIKTNIGILGAYGSGKTSLCRALSNDHLPAAYKRGLEIYSSFLTTSSDNKNGNIKECTHEVVIHDIPREFGLRVPSAYESLILSSDCILLVCSLSDIKSFDDVVNILEYMKSANLNKPVIVLANKLDIALKDENSIKIRFGFYRYVSSTDHPCIEVSAKNQSGYIDWWKTILSEIETSKELRSRNELLKVNVEI